MFSGLPQLQKVTNFPLKGMKTATHFVNFCKPPSSPPISIDFEFRSKPSLITIICMDPQSPNKLIATKYCFHILLDEQIPVSFSQSDFLIFRFSVISCYFVIIKFYKNHIIIIIILFIYFFREFFFFFSCSGMFQDFPECSGKFWNVPCSGFYQHPFVSALVCSFPPYTSKTNS